MKHNSLSTRSVLIGVTVDHAVPYHNLLARAFAEAGWQVHFVSTEGANLLSLDERINPHSIGMARKPNLMQDLRSVAKWFELVKSVKPDLVIIGTPKASMLGIFVSKILRVPNRVYWVHGLRLETAEGFLYKLLLGIEKFTAWNATSLISVSGSLSEKIEVLQIAPTDKVKLIGFGSTQGVDIDRFRPNESNAEKQNLKNEFGLNENLTTIGFVGRLTADKGVSELVKALLSLESKNLKFQVLFVGQFEDQESVNSVLTLKERGIPVVQTGHLSDTSKCYRAMDIFCLPSYREGLPNVVLEALASAVPVVGTSVTGTADLISHRENGLLVPPRDAAQLELAIEELYYDKELSAQLGRNGLKYVRDNFDSKVVVSNQLNFFERLVL
ncbi:glycosyltransferase family 4 protein [Corynebacterium glutamicum]|uniref:glycosyltransferase family 4 protein n=1 Tax=Corynebacterium glutamicum TaxID=1718 RepID=UPI000771EF60|nr:glycosyltransferase family 4 protein [Corynebacterium glutamicum]ALZ99135.2 hypothetical protein APT58_02190 [Corynebacterium glutamicum]